MLIPASYTDAPSPSTVWEGMFRATWWLTLVLAGLGALAAPIDLFAGENPLRQSIGVGDRIANAVVIVLIQNVVLAFILFAAHVTRLLEEVARANRTVNGHTSPAATRTAREAEAQPISSPESARGADEPPAHLWDCPNCGSRNGMFDKVKCWRCQTTKPASKG